MHKKGYFRQFFLCFSCGGFNRFQCWKRKITSILKLESAKEGSNSNGKNIWVKGRFNLIFIAAGLHKEHFFEISRAAPQDNPGKA